MIVPDSDEKISHNQVLLHLTVLCTDKKVSVTYFSHGEPPNLSIREAISLPGAAFPYIILQWTNSLILSVSCFSQVPNNPAITV